METLTQDLRHALRTLLRTPTLTIAAIVCLALGIGANATIFGVVDTLLVRPPTHVERPGDVVRLYFRKTSSVIGMYTSSTAGYPLYTALRDSARAFQSVAAFTRGQTTSLGRGAEAMPIKVSLVSATFFPLLGVRPALGRFFGEGEDRQGAPLVVVLSHDFWRRQFGADSGLLGRPLPLGKGSYTVVGVAPKGFVGINLQNVDAWAPIAAATPDLMGASWLTRGSFFLQTVGRLRPGATPAQAAHEATLVLRAEDALTSHPDSNATALLGPVQAARGPEMSQDAKVASWLAIVAAIVLFIACANVVNILLARAVQRRQEMAIRRAMGAGRRDLARQLLIESVLIAIAGAAAALIVALWTGPVIRAFLLRDVPAAATVVDVRVLVFTGAIALLVGLLTGLAPALRAGHEDLTHALKAGPREGRFQHGRLRSLLLGCQVALTLALLVGAGLFAKSLRRVREIDIGFDPERVLTATMDFTAAGISRQEANRLYLLMLERVRALPDVERAAASVGSPFGWSIGGSVSVPGRDSIPRISTGGPYQQLVTHDYFPTMSTPVRGRGFTPSDAGTKVVVLNETMARLLWPGESAIGKCVIRSDNACHEVIGVVPDARRFGVVEDPAMQFYAPLSAQDAEGERITTLVVRVRGDPARLIEPVRREMQGVQSNLPFAQVAPLADLVAPSIRSWRLGTTMFGLFALLALLLAAVGLYGVLAYTVGQRTHELGVRIALGAQGHDVVRMVLGQGVRVAALGVAAGAILALVGGRAVASLLYGVAPHDPAVLAFAGAALIGVAALASYLPARRAAKVDPIVALRTE